MDAPRTVAISPAPGLPRGTVRVCTPNDRAELVDLYRAVCPQADLEEIAAWTKPEQSSAWASYRNEAGEIKVAMFLWEDGCVRVFAKPTECGSREVLDGFLMLAQEVRAFLATRGVRDLSIMHDGSLQPLGDALEKSGFLSREIHVLRHMHFGESGQVLRRQ